MNSFIVINICFYYTGHYFDKFFTGKHKNITLNFTYKLPIHTTHSNPGASIRMAWGSMVTRDRRNPRPRRPVPRGNSSSPSSSSLSPNPMSSYLNDTSRSTVSACRRGTGRADWKHITLSPPCRKSSLAFLFVCSLLTYCVEVMKY